MLSYNIMTSAIFLQLLRSYHVQNTAPPQFWLGAEQAVSCYILARFVLPYRVFGNLRVGPPMAHMGGKDSVPGGQLQEYCMEHWIDSDISVPSQAKHVIHKLTQMDLHVHTRTHTYVYLYCYIYPLHVLLYSRRSVCEFGEVCVMITSHSQTQRLHGQLALRCLEDLCVAIR